MVGTVVVVTRDIVSSELIWGCCPDVASPTMSEGIDDSPRSVIDE